jgi:hypothetical protein
VWKATVAIENEKLKAVVVKVNCPYDRRASYVFSEKVYDKHSDALVIMGDDFNVNIIMIF